MPIPKCILVRTCSVMREIGGSQPPPPPTHTHTYTHTCTLSQFPITHLSPILALSMDIFVTSTIAIDIQGYWKRLYNTHSGLDRGTLFHLRNLINRRNVTKSPKNDMNATEDFFELVVIGYVLTAVMSHLGMASVDDSPLPSIVSPDTWMEDDSARKATLNAIASQIIDKHVDLAMEFSDKHQNKDTGTVYDYSCELLTLGLLYLNFKDAVREGDGDRVMTTWKYFMLIFKATGRKNYALEAHTMLTQYHITLPPHLAEQLKWSRFVNVHGLCGRNVSCDLHMEHMNRLVKTAIQGLGANKSEKAIIRTGKCVGSFSTILEKYDGEAGLTEHSGKHSKNMKDLSLILKELMECKVFDPSSTKRHKSFPALKKNLIRTLDEKDTKEWIVNCFCRNALHQNETLDENIE